MRRGWGNVAMSAGAIGLALLPSQSQMAQMADWVLIWASGAHAIIAFVKFMEMDEP